MTGASTATSRPITSYHTALTSHSYSCSQRRQQGTTTRAVSDAHRSISEGPGDEDGRSNNNQYQTATRAGQTTDPQTHRPVRYSTAHTVQHIQYSTVQRCSSTVPYQHHTAYCCTRYTTAPQQLTTRTLLSSALTPHHRSLVLLLTTAAALRLPAFILSPPPCRPPLRHVHCNMRCALFLGRDHAACVSGVCEVSGV